MIIRLSNGLFTLSELFLSSLTHLIYGFYIFSTAVAADLSQTLIDFIKKPRQNNGGTGISEPSEELKRAEGFCGTGSVPPIVLVHGIFGFGKGRLGGLSYFAGAEKKDEFVLVPDLGSLTSIYDRARDLFYYLKGGRVDYGEEHSKTFGHSRFGKLYERGHYEDWDENHPIHFVGHSAGAQVIRVLQQMLHDKEFEGYESTNEDWVLSVTSLSGALNGTTRTYLDGMMPEDGRSLKPISLLQLCRLGVILYDSLDLPFLKSYYNFGFDHFPLSFPRTGLAGLWALLLNKSGPFAAGDWILPDLTIQGSARMNEGLRTFGSCYYFAYATRKTRRVRGVRGGVTVPAGLGTTHWMLALRVVQMCVWRWPRDVELPYKGYRDEDWEENDGALNTISMTHPRLPVEHPSMLVVNDSDCQPLQPGIWYYKIVEADHIYFIINRERAGVQFDLIYDSIFRNCRKNILRKSPQPALPNHTAS